MFSLTEGLASAVPKGPEIRAAERELKREKGYKRPPIYERARRIIYGSNPPPGPGMRTRIAVVINGDENIVVEEQVKDEIYAQLREKFPRDSFAVMKGNDVRTILLQRAEDQYFAERGSVEVREAYDGSNAEKRPDSGAPGLLRGAADFVLGSTGSARRAHDGAARKKERLDVDGMPVRMQPRGLADMRRTDYVDAGRALGYDYLFIATLSNGEANDEKHNFIVASSVTNRKNVWLRLRFVDVDSGDYLYRNDLAVQAKTHNGGRASGRILRRAVSKAMTEAMNDISITD